MNWTSNVAASYTLGLMLMLSSAAGANAQRASTQARASVVDGILVKDGILVLRGRDTVKASIVLERNSEWLRVIEIASQTTRVTSDTVDATGLYVHTATPVPMSGSRVNSPGVYALRTGPSAGDPAVGVVGRTVRPGWRPIAPDENHPPGPVDRHAGCYVVERGAWSDSNGAMTLSSAVIPDDVRLHWQYLWYWGREHDLVATDAHGAVAGDRTTVHVWEPIGADSIRISFGTGFVNAIFRMVRSGEDLVGQVTKLGDNQPGPEPKAAVRLRRIACPA